MHRFLNFADLEKSFETERARLIAEKKITAAEAAVLRKEKVEEYKKSDVYKAVKNAPEVIREKGVKSADEALQGAMDICCIYDDGLVIVDYKTDRLSEEELISKYSFQLYLYSVAAEKMYSLPVKKAYIWSFGLGKGIDVTPFFA